MLIQKINLTYLEFWQIRKSAELIFRHFSIILLLFWEPCSWVILNPTSYSNSACSNYIKSIFLAHCKLQQNLKFSKTVGGNIADLKIQTTGSKWVELNLEWCLRSTLDNFHDVNSPNFCQNHDNSSPKFYLLPWNNTLKSGVREYWSV